MVRLPDGTAPLAPVVAGYRREEEARSTLEALQRANFITLDWLAGKARLLESNIAAVLLGPPEGAAGELFTQERPLDLPLAECARIPRTHAGAESAPSEPNRTRVESTSISNSNSRSAESARAYIEEKLAKPELFHVLKEVTGGVAHMQKNFARLFDERPERLAEIIGEAATPRVLKKARWLNSAMRRELLHGPEGYRWPGNACVSDGANH